MNDINLTYVIDLALHLSLAEQAKLLERVASNLAQHVEQVTTEIPDEADLVWSEAELTACILDSENWRGNCDHDRAWRIQYLLLRSSR